MNINLPAVLLFFAIAMIVYDRHRSGRGFGLGRHRLRREYREERRDEWRGIADEKEQSAGQDEETQRELEALRERVKVLERITVDERDTRSIADEIESLRNK